MPSIGYLLMTEFNALAQAELAKPTPNYDRKIAFNDAENMVNNFIHGNTAEDVLRLTRQALQSNIDSGNYGQDEAEAILEAILMIDLFAEQYHLDIVNT